VQNRDGLGDGGGDAAGRPARANRDRSVCDRAQPARMDRLAVAGAARLMPEDGGPAVRFSAALAEGVDVGGRHAGETMQEGRASSARRECPL